MNIYGHHFNTIMVTLQPIKNLLGFFDSDSYLICLCYDLHHDLINYICGDIECLIRSYETTHDLTIKFRKHQLSFSTCRISGFLDWLINRSHNSTLQLYGTYGQNPVGPCKCLFNNRSNVLHIDVQCLHNESIEMIFNDVELLIVVYKLMQLFKP